MATTKKRIIFVDDEPNIIEALQRMLRSMRQNWDMEFTDSGVKALEIMKNSPPFDIVVSDMRMPGMNGIEFLTEVMKSYPSAIRFVLSGQMEKEIGLKAVRVANQCLWKPCDTETLKIAITRAYTLRNRLSDKSLQKLVSQLESLPSLPSLYTQLNDEITSTEPSMEAIGNIISKDIAMTSKILQLVNSAFFGIAKTISNPTEAVKILGIDLISSLVLTIKIFKEYKGFKISSSSIATLWQHSLQTAAFAREIAKTEKANKDIVAGCFLAGLLHDIGKLILMINLENKYIKSLELMQTKGLQSWQAEKEVFNASHGDIGASLLGTWGLPEPVVEAIAFHHYPKNFGGTVFRPLTAIHVANIIVNNIDKSNEDIILLVDKEYIENCKLTNHLDQWITNCKNLDVQGISL